MEDISFAKNGFASNVSGILDDMKENSDINTRISRIFLQMG